MIAPWPYREVDSCLVRVGKSATVMRVEEARAGGGCVLAPAHMTLNNLLIAIFAC